MSGNTVDRLGPQPTAITPEHAAQRHRAVRVIAGWAADAEECARVLAMLGLNAAEGRQVGGIPTHHRTERT